MPIQIVHISDTHIGSDKDFAKFGVKPYERAVVLVDLIKKFVKAPDLVVHTGDVVFDPDERSYELARNLFSALAVPVIYINGNHDSCEMMRRFLKYPDVKFMDNDLKCLTFEYRAESFRVIALETRPSKNPWCGEIDPKTLRFLDNSLGNASEPVVVALHYPPSGIGSPWVDRKLVLEGADELHAVLVKHGSNVRCVMSGHMHRDASIFRDGVYYSGCGSSWVQFGSWYWREEVSILAAEPPSFKLTTIFDTHVTAQTFTYSSSRSFAESESTY